MKINSKFFSFPPYLSTSWTNVLALHMNADTLVVSLVDGNMIEIPGLQGELVELIFAAHSAFLEHDASKEQANHANPSSGKVPASILSSLMHPEGDSENNPFRIGFSAMDGFGSMLQHNPAQANSPEIPREILQKISAIAKIVGPDNPNHLPKAEPHCNCMFCQIARAISQESPLKTPENKQSEEPQVSEADLKFCQWEIHQTGEKMYDVTNKLDTTETYHIYLGEPVGCTCGQSGCEHILAVLQS